MTRRFRPAEYAFEPPAYLRDVEVGSHSTANR
jgi:hypothetical protein